MSRADRQVRRRKAPKSARAEGSQPLTSSQIRNGLNGLSAGVQESFARIKILQDAAEAALEDLHNRLTALEKGKEERGPDLLPKEEPEAAKKEEGS